MVRALNEVDTRLKAGLDFNADLRNGEAIDSTWTVETLILYDAKNS